VSAPPSAEVERVRITTRAGWSLDAGVLEAEGRARGTALLVHALGASSHAFLSGPGAGLAGRLAAAGFRAVVFDLRGHGARARDAGPEGRWSFDAVVRGDLAVLAETLRERFDGPLALVGHGLGGLAACAAAGSGALEPDALVLFGVSPWLPRLDPSPLRRFVKASLLAGGSGKASKVTIGRALRGAIDAPGAPRWAQFWPEAARWWEANAWLDESGHDYLAALRRVGCPALVFSSRADPLLCAPPCAQAFAARLGASRLEHHVVGGLGASGPGHRGLVTSERAAPLWHQSADWLAHLAR
jgi:alpha-beta hydrolase superfamily lysophospholipase